MWVRRRHVIKGSTPLRRTLVCALLSAALTLPAAALGDDGLTSFELRLLGISARPEPEAQVVPRNTPTGIRIAIDFAGSSADADAMLALLPSELEVAAELVGPGIETPIQLRGRPGALLPIPPLVARGNYLVRDIRLELSGELLLRAFPDAAHIEVIERVIVTQVTTRPLSAEEIRQQGIIFGDENFKAFNFTLSLKLDSRPVNIDFPVVFDANDVAVPTRASTSIDLMGAGGSMPFVNAQMQPVLLKLNLPAGAELEMPDEVGDVSIPGLLVIPGDVGFLNQFFSAMLVVSNAAPLGSGLTVRDLEGTIRLPSGEDDVAGTADDPLVVAETGSGSAFTVAIVGLGADGVAGTGDDTDHFWPGEHGEAEYLLEGRREGYHRIDFDITGTLEGLPIGPIELTGTARGGVVVRNPFFNLTFSAPRTVRRFEEFTLFINVTNTSSSTANFVSVTLNALQLSGADLVSPSTREIETLEAGDSETLRFRFRSLQTGEVTASYLNFEPNAGDDNEGELLFALGVGERGAPLSPDTLVLPTSLEALPTDVVDQAFRVLGQAWSIATAPEGTVPDGVIRVSKQVVIDRAVELAEAGLRVQLGEELASSLSSLAFTWIAASDAGFEQLLRTTQAGEAFRGAIGAEIGTSDAIAVWHRNLAARWTSRPPHLLVSVGDATLAAPVTWELRNAGFSSALENAGVFPLSNLAGPAEPAGPGRAAALVTALSADRYEVRWTAAAAGNLDLLISLPRADGSLGIHSFEGLSVSAGDVGMVTLDLIATSAPLVMSIDADGDGIFETSVEAAPEEILEASGPELLSATVIGPETLSGADSFGRAVALLFDRELRPEEANLTSSYALDAHGVLSARTQLSGRLVFLFLDQPAGDLVERELTVSGLFDTTGRPMLARTIPLGSRVVPPDAVGGVVSGRVLDAVGSPIEGARVVYLNSTGVGGSIVGLGQHFTGPDGAYQFDWVRRAERGPFIIRAFDPATGGFQERSTTVRTHGERLVVDLVMRGRGGVTGIVSDLSGDPVPGARVLVTSEVDAANWALIESDGSGRYVATDIIVGAVSVKAVSGPSSGLASGNLQRAGIFTTVDVTINTGAGTVVSRVLEIDGADVTTPVPRARIFYLVPGAGGLELIAGSGDTDEEGLFVFEDVPTGPFRIVAFDLVRGYQASKTGELVVTEEGVVVNGCVDGECQVIFEEEAVGTITGEVRLASGGPAVGAVVTAGGLQATTGVDGTFRIESVASGTHSVTAVFGAGRHASTTINLVTGTTVNVSLSLPGVGSVVVTMLDVDGSPLAGQTVIRVTSGCAGFPQVTNTYGVATFSDVAVPGGYFKALRNNDVADGYATIRSDTEAASIALRFGGFGTVTGTVVDAEGDPIHGADVVLGAKVANTEYCVLMRQTRARQMKTGPDGTFRFENVSIGAVHVSASSFFLPIPVAASANLLAHGDVKNFTLHLTSSIAGELSGTVFLSDGTTAAGPDVEVTVSGSRPDVTVRTDVAGRYSFAKIFPAGRYTIVAADARTGKLVKELVFLQADQDLTRNLRLLGQGSVNVTVVDGGGTPLEDAFVEIKGARYPFFQSARAITVSDGGTVQFVRVPEGSFSVTANDDEGRGGRSYGALVEDGSSVDITVSLTITGTVTGTYKTSDGATPIPNAEVALRQGTGRFLGSTVTSNQAESLGTFSFDFVPAGNVLVTAMDPLTGRLGEASGMIETQDQVVELEILQLGLGTISGTVTTGGVAVAASEVRLISTTGLSSAVPNLRAYATTDAVGGFVFDGVPVGHFDLRATVPGLLLVGTETGFIDTDAQQIDDIEIQLAASGTLTGDIFHPDGATPVPTAALTIRPPKGTIRTDSDAVGRYQTAFVPVGAFDIQALESGGPDAGIASGELAENETLEVDVVFNGTGTVRGEARDFDATLLTTGTVRLTRSSPFARDEWATVASDGTFQFFGVPVGSYHLSLAVAGEVRRGTAAGEIELDGDVDSITIKLADAGYVTGVVVKEEDAVTPAPNTVIEVRGSGFMLSVLTGVDGRFDVTGVPLGSFEVWAEDPVTQGLARVFGELVTAGQIVDAGTLVLDTQPIEVESITPAPGTTVPPDTPIVVRFTDPTTIAHVYGRLFVSSSGANMTGTTTLSPDGLELTFTPRVGAAAAFPPTSTIDVLIKGAIADTFGRRMGEDFRSAFSTGAAVVIGTVVDGSLPAVGVNVTLTAAGDFVDVTDAAGSYRFEDVPQGTILVQAVDPGDGRGASASRSLGASDALVTIDLALGFLGSVTGQVFDFDATPASPGLDVVVSNSSGTLATTTTDDNGSYALANIPVGSVTLDVINPVTSDRGRATGAVVNGATTNLDVTMEGVGSLRLFVRDADENIVTTANTRLSFDYLPLYRATLVYRAIHNDAPEGDGSYLFPYVPAGSFDVYASDGLSGLAASGAATIAAGEELVLDIVLEPAGSVRVVVLAPGGSSPVLGAAIELRRWNYIIPHEVLTSDTSGEALFENIPVALGPYFVEVELEGRLRARARDVSVAGGSETLVELTIAGLGSVSGRVIPPDGESLSSNVRVDLTSFAEEVGGVLSDADATDGTYLIENVPVGAFTVDARDHWNGYQGEVAGAVTAHGENVTVDIPLQDNSIDFSIYGNRLYDGNSARYNIRQDGRLDSEPETIIDYNGDALNLEVTVAGGVRTPFTGLSTGSQEESGRELVTATEDIDGVRVQRKIFVPRDGYFVRYLEVFENLGDADVDVTATLTSHLWSRHVSNGNLDLAATSSGDVALDVSDVWIIADDAKDQDPFDGTTTGSFATAFVFAGEPSLTPTLVDFAPDGTRAVLTVDYDVTVPAGGRAIVLHFVSPVSFRDSAHAAAHRLRRLPPESLVGLGLDEIATIVNFNVPEDGVSDVEALPPLDGNVFGQLLAHDGVTGVGTNTGAGRLPVKFNSDQILYRRVRTLTADGDGRFSFETEYKANAHVVIPRVGFALASSRSVASSTVSASASSDFEARTLVSRAVDASVSATSVYNIYTGPEKAVDGNEITEWRVANGVTSATLELSSPDGVGVEVDTIRIVPHYLGSLSQVQIDLLGDLGQVLDSRTEPFQTPDGALTVVVDPAVDGVHKLNLLFTGDAIRVSELEVFATTSVDLGSAVSDLTFTGTAGIRVEATRASGEGLKAGIFARSVPTAVQVVSATTGDDGVFALLAPFPSDIGPIDFTLTATHAVVGHSFLKATGQVTLTPDTTTVLNIVFPETAAIAGQVTSSTGAALGNRWLSLFPSTGSGLSTRTDASGFFAVENLPADTYRLRIVQNGRSIYSPPIELSPPSSQVVNLQIPSFGSIDLRVFAATAEGAPARPVSTTVTVVDTLGARSFATNASGQKTITNVAGPSQFTLEVRHPSDAANVTIETGSIVADGDVVVVTVVIPALGTLSGTVSFADGATAASAAVELSGAGVTPRMGATNTLGSYSFDNVEGLRPLSVVARHPALDRSHVFAVASGEVPGDGETAAIHVSLPGTGTVEVNVVELDGATPIPGVSISMLDSFSGEYRSEGATSGDGVRAVDIVPEGSFTVRAELDGEELGTASGEIPAGTVGTLVAVTISRPPEASVEGTVFAADGITPVAGAPVRLLTVDDATEIASRVAGVDGVYRFAYVLPIGASSIVRAELPADATVSDEALVAATEPGETIVSDLVLPAKAITGRVLESDLLTPVAGATVDAVVEGRYSDGTNTALTDSDGGFTIVGLGQGSYELMASGPDGLRGYASVVLALGDDTAEQDVSLPGFGVVAGTVRDASGAPPPGVATAEVTLQNANVDPPRSALPDATGFYRFERVAEGAFTVVYDDASSELSGATTSFLAAGAELGGEPSNLVRGFGVTANASSSYGYYYRPELVIDGDLMTTWYAAYRDAVHLGGSPFLEVVFPVDATVSEIRMFGNRRSTRYDFLAGYFELFDESGNVLFDTGVFEIPEENRDVVLAAPDVARVRRVRFTATDDEGSFPGFAELEIYGELVVSDLALEPGVSTNVSSSYPRFEAERAIDGNLRTSWLTGPGDAVHLGSNPFYEVVLPQSAIVTEIQMYGNRQYASGYDFFAGRFELLDAAGGVVFDSGTVTLPAPERDIVIAIPDVGGVIRVRFTPTDDQGSTPGFAELVVLGTFERSEAPTPDINLPDTGSVSGQLLASDAMPTTPTGESAPLRVRSNELESRTGVVSQDDSVDGAGLYYLSGVAEGNITVSVIDLDEVEGVGEAGILTATVEAGLETTGVDVQLGTGRALPLELGLPENLRHLVQPDGSVHGELDTLAASVELAAVSVNGKAYPAQDVAGVELSGRQLVLGPVRMSGLDHTRKVFVPVDGRFVRFLDVIENPHDFDVEVTVVLDGALKATNLETSSGDASLDRTDRYLAGELDTGVGLGVVYAGSGAVRLPDASATNDDAYAFTWRNLVVPAGGRIILLNFAVQAGTRAEALAEAEALLELTDPDASADLTPAEKADIVNFIVP